MDFLEDTGANTMTIWDTDRDQLISFNGRPVPVPICLGETLIHTASDTVTFKMAETSLLLFLTLMEDEISEIMNTINPENGCVTDEEFAIEE